MAKVSNFDGDLKGLFKVYFCNGRDGYLKEKGSMATIVNNNGYTIHN